MMQQRYKEEKIQKICKQKANLIKNKQSIESISSALSQIFSDENIGENQIETITLQKDVVKILLKPNQIEHKDEEDEDFITECLENEPDYDSVFRDLDLVIKSELKCLIFV